MIKQYQTLISVLVFASYSLLFAQDASEQVPLMPERKGGDVQFDPNVATAKIYYEGAETLGRVGYEAILKRDVLHQLRKYAQLTWIQQAKNMDEATRQKQGDEIRKKIHKEYLSDPKFFSEVLDNYIRKLLYYNDFVVSRSKDQVDEQKKKLTEIFEKEYVPEMMKQFDCKSILELDEYFKREMYSTLAQERRIFIQETIGSSWLEFNLGADTFDPTVVDLRRYYEAHLDKYKEEERVLWQSMSVRFSNHGTKEEAMVKIARMGNRVMAARTKEEIRQLFTKVAKEESEDFFAKDGGKREWTQRGSLSSKVVENAIFSESLPEDRLSRILEDQNGYIIVLVLRREEATWTPFIKVQEEVRKTIKSEHRKALQLQYEDALSKRFTIELYKLGEDEQKIRQHSFFGQSRSATGRESNN